MSDPVQLAIRLWTGSEFTHSALILDGEVWEFTRSGFRRSKAEVYPGDWLALDFLGLTEEKEELMRAEMNRIASSPGRYDWFALTGIVAASAVRLLAGCLTGSMGGLNPFQHPGRYFCSEYVAMVSAAAGYHHGKSPGFVYPSDHIKVPWLLESDPHGGAP